MSELKNKLEKFKSENSLIREEITYDDIAEIVSKWTGIPVAKMIQSERENF